MEDINMPSVKQAWINKYGQQIGLQMWQQQKKKYGKTNQYFRQKYGQQYVDNLNKKRTTFTLQYFIDKYGQQIGTIKWNQCVSKKVQSCKEKRQSGEHKSTAITLCGLQNKHGIEKGYKIWQKKIESLKYKNSKQRYIDEYGQLEGQRICRNKKDNLSLPKFIQRYGAIDGVIKYKQMCQNRSIQYHKNLRETIIKHKIVQKTIITNTPGRYSKISQQMFFSIYDKLSDDLKQYCFFGKLNNQVLFYINKFNGHPNNVIYVDFKCLNSIIQFDGDYWHRNSKQNDEIRDSFLQSKKYTVLRIKQSQYKRDKNQIINKCVGFINERSLLQ